MLNLDPKYGFELLRTQPVKELEAQLHHLRHGATGLELIWLERADENKTFGIAFQTLPEDDTGVFHILEHSVLCGSDRYRLKEPFVELMKSSMNTFLNAMTFADRTFYPISSRNDKDFLNLMRVYLDAVFHPLIYSRPEIFRQEGWHYEFGEDGGIGYKGVVYNEMRGAFSDADELADAALLRALFPASPYRFVSGGDPEHIPELSYEAFVDSHRRFYSPSNAYVFLDGAVDIDAALSLLSGEYLDGALPGARIAPPAAQESVKAASQTLRYELPGDEEGEKRCRLYWGGVAADFSEREKLTAAQLLCTALCGDNQAPLCRCILSQQLAEAVNMSLWDGTSQPWLKLEVRNFASGGEEAVRGALRAELERLAREGLDHEKLLASMANMEFQMRERDYGTWPQGLIYGLNILDSWMRGGAPEQNLEVGDLFDRLRSKLDEGYFEGLLRELLLENGHCAEVLLLPSSTLGEERRRAEAARIERAASLWTEEERGRLRREQEELAAWQASSDSPEALASLPRLRLSDLSGEPESFPCELDGLAGASLLRHEIPAGGISYVTLYFDVSGLSAGEISALSFLCRVLRRVSTARTGASDLSRRVQLLTGDMSFFASSFEMRQRPGDYSLKLCASVSLLESKAAEALSLLGEVLTETRFDSAQEILDLLRQSKNRMFQSIVNSGHSLSISRVSAQFSAAAAAAECAGGYSFYDWLKRAEAEWGSRDVPAELEALYRRAISRDTLTVSVTGSRSEAVDRAVASLIESLPGRGRAAGGGVSPLGRAREGIEIPSDVCYASMGGVLDAPFDGTWQLSSRVASLAWLWNAVRVQGGAYGTGMLARDTRFAGCYSYRDPNAAASLESYRKVPGFLRDFAASGQELDGFIIGAVSDSEPLLTTRAKGITADSLYFRGCTQEQRREQRRQLLAAGGADLERMAGLLDVCFADAGVCVLGPREKLDACGLDRILTL